MPKFEKVDVREVLDPDVKARARRSAIVEKVVLAIKQATAEEVRRNGGKIKGFLATPDLRVHERHYLANSRVFNLTWHGGELPRGAIIGGQPIRKIDEGMVFVDGRELPIAACKRPELGYFTQDRDRSLTVHLLGEFASGWASPLLPEELTQLQADGGLLAVRLNPHVIPTGHQKNPNLNGVLLAPRPEEISERLLKIRGAEFPVCQFYDANGNLVLNGKPYLCHRDWAVS